MPPKITVIAIGRNEARHLARCFDSLRPHPVVYVDSGSSDRSLLIAAEHGAQIVQLVPPYSAARARNAGFTQLLALHPDTDFTLFLDADCELLPDFLPAALAEMTNNPSLAIVCGRRKERHPTASIYNTLIDVEWNTPLGITQSCGGDALMRTSALRNLSQLSNPLSVSPKSNQAFPLFNPILIAGEEPELCHRLRRLTPVEGAPAGGYKILRIPTPMTIHDANIHSLPQFLRRFIRSGYGGLDVEHRTRANYFKKEIRRARTWALLFPLTLLLAAIISPFLLPFPYFLIPPLAIIALWLIQLLRIARYGRRNNLPTSTALAYAALILLSYFPQLLGQLRYTRDRLTKKNAHIIEYKPTPQATN